MYKPLTTFFLLTLLAMQPSRAEDTGYDTAIFAGGCFWCVEADFEKLSGVVAVVSGYSGGQLPEPSYERVSSGTTGHLEAVEVRFDPEVVSYRQLLDYYWRHIDPTRDDGQFCDQGAQYRPVIFYRGEQQQKLAEASKLELERTKPFADKIQVELKPASRLYPAEAYHQDYYRKNPIRYRLYRYLCGRDQRLEELWGN